jgi:hypothetical protein
MKHVFEFALVCFVVLSVTRAQREGRQWGNRDDGFEELFNDANLRGWKGDPALWSIEMIDERVRALTGILAL